MTSRIAKFLCRGSFNHEVEWSSSSKKDLCTHSVFQLGKEKRWVLKCTFDDCNPDADAL